MALTDTAPSTNGHAPAAAEWGGGKVEIRPLERATVVIPIVGVTPLIPHQWSEKALRMMRESQSGRAAKAKKEPKVAEAEAEAATYRLADGRPGMPATAFKAAIVDACKLYDGLPMTRAKIAFHVEGEGASQLVPIEGESEIREDTPRNATGVVDLRYRRYFFPWSAALRVVVVKSIIDMDSLVNLVDAAGSGGVGDWRPSAPKSKTGTYGQWQVDGTARIAVAS